MDSKGLLGISIMAIIAYLLFRSKRSDSVSQSDPLEEVELRNLKLKEASLSKELELDLQVAINRVYDDYSAINYYQWQKATLPNVRSWNQKFSDSVKKYNQEYDELLRNRINNLEANKQFLQIEVDEANKILDTQSFYGAESLTDIRKRINQAESV